MTSELQSGDETTEAIQRVTATMGGGGDSSSVERYLMDQGVLQTRAEGRVAVFACLACQLEQPFQPGAYGGQIERCTRWLSGALSPLLRQLEEGGVLVSWHEQGSPRDVGRPLRKYFAVADTPQGAGFAERVTPPEVCYKEQPPKEPGIEAEKYLLLELPDVSGKIRSHQRRRALGCIACHLRSPQTDPYVTSITDCTGATKTHIRGLLHQLEQLGILESHEEEGDPHELKRGLRTYYSIADTPRGKAFARILDPPEDCERLSELQ
jgi:DNA-binding PadR family transcriptional regulator